MRTLLANANAHLGSKTWYKPLLPTFETLLKTADGPTLVKFAKTKVGLVFHPDKLKQTMDEPDRRRHATTWMDFTNNVQNLVATMPKRTAS